MYPGNTFLILIAEFDSVNACFAMFDSYSSDHVVRHKVGAVFSAKSRTKQLFGTIRVMHDEICNRNISFVAGDLPHLLAVVEHLVRLACPVFELSNSVVEDVSICNCTLRRRFDHLLCLI